MGPRRFFRDRVGFFQPYGDSIIECDAAPQPVRPPQKLVLGCNPKNFICDECLFGGGFFGEREFERDRERQRERERVRDREAEVRQRERERFDRERGERQRQRERGLHWRG